MGGTALATDETGLVTQLYDYHPYGTELLNESYDPTSSTPYSFTGKEYTEDSGLFYFEARWYDPLIGRFVSEDPLAHKLKLLKKDFENFLIDKTDEIFKNTNDSTKNHDYSQKKDLEQKLHSQNKKEHYTNEIDEKTLRYLKNPQNLNQYSYSLNNPLTLIDPTGELTEETTKEVIKDAGLILFGGVTLTVSVWAKSPQGIKAGISTIVGPGIDAIEQIWNDPDMANVKEGVEEFVGDVVNSTANYASDLWQDTKEFVSGKD